MISPLPILPCLSQSHKKSILRKGIGVAHCALAHKIQCSTIFFITWLEEKVGVVGHQHTLSAAHAIE